MTRFFRLPALMTIALLTLTACESVEEKAQKHFESGVELLEKGDVDRAIVELRNVFQLDPAHLDARQLLAEVLLNEKKAKRRAYRQYLRIAEQYPDELDTRIILTELALGFGNWEEVERHGGKATELAGDDPRVKALNLVRTYRAAALDEDLSKMRDIARDVETMLENQPDSAVLRTVRIDAALRDGAFTQALADIDWLLERDVDNQPLMQQRLGILVELGDDEGVETQLLSMIDRFPDVDSHKATLIRFYMSRSRADDAESYLRTLANASTENGPRMDLFQFLLRVKGQDAARVELEAAVANSANPLPFQMLLAGLDFENGDHQVAIATIEKVVADKEPSNEINDAKVMLARMQLATGNSVGARARISEVLTDQADHAAALKLQAGWQIEGDDTAGAIANLRVALDKRPDDASAMTLMAQAYAREGRTGLAGDFLALAVEASGNAPEETVRYANVLMAEEKYLPAEDILLPALRLAPQNLSLLSTLGELYLNMEDLGRAQQVVDALKELDTPEADRAATGITAERIRLESGVDEALAYLQQLSEGSDQTLLSRVALIGARIQTGDLEGALKVAETLYEERPDDPVARNVLARTASLNGKLDTARALYEDIVEEAPASNGEAWLELSRIKARQGDDVAGAATIDEGLTHLPNDMRLLWAKASLLEREGDFEGAIAIYADMYERNSNIPVVANNLASLLSTYREDEESLNRAWVVARRFKDTQVPQLQDTYGWILHRRGESEAALQYLEPAAAALARDPIVQYHLARIYLQLERNDDALRYFRAVTQVASPADNRKQIVQSRQFLQDMQAKIEN